MFMSTGQVPSAPAAFSVLRLTFLPPGRPLRISATCNWQESNTGDAGGRRRPMPMRSPLRAGGGLQDTDTVRCPRPVVDTAARHFLDDLEGVGSALLWFSGYGMNLQTKDLLLRVDADPAVPAAVHAWVRSRQPHPRVSARRLEAAIVVVDACREMVHAASW